MAQRPSALLEVTSLEDRVTPVGTSFNAYRVLVQLPESMSVSAATATLRQVPGAAKIEPLGQGLYRVQTGPGLSIEGAVTTFRQRAEVRYAQPDYRIQLQTITSTLPPAPRFSEQWALRNTGQMGGTPGADISAPQAWTVTTGTRSTIVAIIDTGIDYTHPDLMGNLWVNPREISGNGVDDDGNGFIDDLHGANFLENNGVPFDDTGHGTHVAGVIGAIGNNTLGITGVNWNTRIMPLRFMSGTGGGFTSDAVRAIHYAIDNGAKIINMSWGGAPYDNALIHAIRTARDAGVIVVASAGNDGNNVDSQPFYPGSYSLYSDNVVTVAATGLRDQVPAFSNTGANTVLLAAPGENILSTSPGNSYRLLSGTSMAAPHVAGALSLLWDAHPTWTYRQVLDKLRSSVDTLSSLAGKTSTAGRLNLAKLLDAPVAVAPTPPVVPPPAVPPPAVPLPAVPPTNQPLPRVVSASFSGPRAGTLDRVRVAFNTAMNATTLRGAVTVNGPLGPINISAVLPIAGTNNSQFNLMFSTIQTASGSYTFSVGPNATDALGQRLDQNSNGVVGEAADRFSLSTTLGSASSPPVVPPPPASPPAAPPPTTTPVQNRLTYTMPGSSRAILDRRTTRVDFTITDEVRLSDIQVSLDITHGRTADLNIRLVAPDGTIVTLFNRRGSGANLRNLTFTDSATQAVSTATGALSGNMRPEQSFSPLVGKAMKGVWSLQIFDLADGVTGTLNRASLSFGVSSTANRQQSFSPAVHAALTQGRPDQLAFA